MGAPGYKIAALVPGIMVNTPNRISPAAGEDAIVVCSGAADHFPDGEQGKNIPAFVLDCCRIHCSHCSLCMAGVLCFLSSYL